MDYSREHIKIEGIGRFEKVSIFDRLQVLDRTFGHADWLRKPTPTPTSTNTKNQEQATANYYADFSRPGSQPVKPIVPTTAELRRQISEIHDEIVEPNTPDISDIESTMGAV